MATVKQRVFAGFGASLFLITSSALTVIVIITLVQQSRDNKKAAATTSAASSATNSSTSTQAGEKMQNFTPTQSPQTQLQVIDSVVGTGAEVKSTDSVTVNYVGALMNTGVILDASANHGGTATFGLNQVIKGWTLGIPGMKVGGTRRLLIPADLAYGAGSPSSGIPANSDLVFDVTLTKIN